MTLHQSTESGGALVFPDQAFAIGKSSHTTTKEYACEVADVFASKNGKRVSARFFLQSVQRDCGAYSDTPHSEIGIGSAFCVYCTLGDYVEEYVQGTFLFWSLVHFLASIIALFSMYLVPGGRVKMENGCLYLVKSGVCDTVFAMAATVQHDCAVTAVAGR